LYNEKGHSLPESLLTLVIIILIFGTLLPFFYRLETSLYEKKLSMHAAEAALFAAGNIKKLKKYEGQITIDKVTYFWEGDENLICIRYAGIQEEKLCVNKD
jgi:hypothetical protein